MTRLLLTGATGFIGSAALRALAGGRYEIHAVSTRRREETRDVVWHVADLLQPDVAEELVRRVRPELLIHLAWYAEHARFWTSGENVRWVAATRRLLSAFGRGGGARVVVSGTCAEYEWPATGGICSEDKTPLRPASLYGQSKNATREYAEALAEETGFELAWGRIFFVYGPGEAETRLVPSVVRTLLEGKPAPVSSGGLVRDFLHVDDVGAATIALLESSVSGAINIGSGLGVSIREVVELIGAATGRPELIRIGADRAGLDEPRSLVADARRLREEVGFIPRIRLIDGLSGSVEWWKDRLARGEADALSEPANDGYTRR